MKFVQAILACAVMASASVCMAQPVSEKPTKSGGAAAVASDGGSKSGGAVDSAKEAKIRKLLELTGAGKLGQQAVAQMIPALKQAMPQVPADYWAEFQKKVRPEDLTDMVVPVYDKYLTDEDLDAINAFYESPAGKKLTSVQPEIMADSMKIGQEWGGKLMQQAIKDLEAKGKAGDASGKPAAKEKP